jgi:hypothetical protein
MAEYKYGNYLKQADKRAYDDLHKPGAPAPYGGIYRCEACGNEATVPAKHTLPPQDHAVHLPSQGRILWRLIVAHGYING